MTKQPGNAKALFTFLDLNNDEFHTTIQRKKIKCYISKSDNRVGNVIKGLWFMIY